MDEEKKRDNHYVPRSYLKQWSNDGRAVWAYDTIVWNKGQKVWRPVGVGGVACWKDFYSQINDDETVDDSIEILFGDEYESRAGDAFKMVRNGDVLASDDMALLVDFAILQMVRTPVWLLKSSALMAGVFPSAATEMLGKLETDYKAGLLTKHNVHEKVRSLPDNAPFPQFEIGVDVDVRAWEIAVSLPLGRKNYLASVGRVLRGDVGKCMRSFDWSVIEMPNGVLLPTCDNPFVRLCVRAGMRPTLDGAVGDPNTHLFMPLTPHHLLYANAGGARLDRRRLIGESSLVDLISGSVVQNALRYVYDRKRSDWIAELRPRRVDPEYCSKMQDVMTHWNELQD